MKKLLLYGFASLLFLASCTKSQDPRVPALAQVPPPLMTIDTTGDATISAADPLAFSGKFKVALYFPTAAKPKQYDVVVEKDNDPDSVKVFKTGITTFPTELSVTGQQLTTLFGTITLGNSFTFGVNITTEDGSVYPAFPVLGSAFPAIDAEAPGWNPTVTFSAVCQFVATDYGSYGVPTPYTVVSDGWGDYAPGSTIPVTVIDATHMSFFYANDVDPKPIIITVNPVDNSTSVTEQEVGGYSGDASYGEFSVATAPPATLNEVSPCALTVSVNLNWTVSAGGFGAYAIVLKKK
jgi:hypothetical protein